MAPECLNGLPGQVGSSGVKWGQVGETLLPQVYAVAEFHMVFELLKEVIWHTVQRYEVLSVRDPFQFAIP